MIDTVIARRKLKQLISTMEKEREILLIGPLEALEKTSQKRDQIMESMLEGGPVSQRILAQNLDSIKALATRNAALLKAAMEGMKDARQTIITMEENLNQMETYSREGERMQVAQTLPGKGHRV